MNMSLCTAALSFVCAALTSAEMVDEVNPFIGCITQDSSSLHGLGKTFPGAATPCGMIQLSPDTITGGDNGPGYSWCMDTIEGFSFTHLSGIGWYGEFGNFQVMPTTGPRVLDREKACSPYSHEREVASPGYYAVTLDRYGVRAEMTAAPRAGMQGGRESCSACARPATRLRAYGTDRLHQRHRRVCHQDRSQSAAVAHGTRLRA